MIRDNKYDAVVIGAGVFGVWTALELSRAGLGVLILDAYGAGNSRASSGGESRIVRAGYGSDALYSEWALRSLTSWKDLAEKSDRQLFHQTGVLWMSREGDAHGLNSIRILKQLGVIFEELSRSGLESRFPQIAFGDVTWGFLEPESGVVIARRAVQTILQEAVTEGVDYLPEAAMTPNGTHRLAFIETTNATKISAGVFVFACGPWLPKLFPDLLAERITATRQDVFFFGAAPGDRRFAPPSMPAWIDFGDEAYGVPDLENRGFKIAFDRHGPVIDPDSADRLMSESSLVAVRQHLARHFPALTNAPLLESRVCQYENTSNGDFLIDRHPELENVWLVGGGSGHGSEHGPAVGEYVRMRIVQDGHVETRFLLESKAKTRRRTVY